MIAGTLLILRAQESDLGALHAIQRAAFREDIDRYGDRPDCPANETLGRLTEKWRAHHYYAFWFEGSPGARALVGGTEVRINPDGLRARVGRIYVAPEYQDRHLGRQAMLGLESLYPQVTEWSLDTPSLNFRNHYFYEKLGYVKVGVTKLDDSFTLYDYKKIIHVPV